MVKVWDILIVVVIGTIVSVIINKFAHIELPKLAVPVLSVVFVIYMLIKWFK